MLKEKRSKGDREARSKLKEKRERQKETQKMYRMRKREKKAAASNVESPAAVDAAIESPAAAAAQNESTSQSGISTPHSVSFSSPQLGTSTPKVVPSTPQPGPFGVRRKRDRKTYMSSYRQNLSRQRKSAIKSRDRQRKTPSEASPVDFNINGKRSGRSKPPLPESPSGFANYVTGF